MTAINGGDLAHRAAIAKAMEALSEKADAVRSDPHRLGYHFMAPAWINDPNGLIHFRGEYHMFYQIHPFSAYNGPKHWGHAKSRDLVRWEHLPIALAPSEPYERHGCFSGSAVEHEDRLMLFYTGNVHKPGKKQVQCMAVSEDGVAFRKYAGNPVIAEPPADGSADFRDPKVWRHEGHWYMAVGSGKEGRGNALLYRSADLLDWAYVGVLAEGEPDQGVFWNCPDYFALGGKDVLLAAPGVAPNDRGTRKGIYRVGRLDYETGRFLAETDGDIDRGPDFYAPQTWADDRGRVVLIGWMDMWWNPMPTQAHGWAGAMTLPREVSMRPDGKLIFTPVPELQALRGEHGGFGRMSVSPDRPFALQGFPGDSLELNMVADLRASDASAFGLKLRRSRDGRQETVVEYRKDARELVVDRTRGGRTDGGVGRIPLEPMEDGTLRLHVFLDRSSLEIFANDGRTVASHRLYPDEDSLGTELFAHGGRLELLSLDAWRLKPVGE